MIVHCIAGAARALVLGLSLVVLASGAQAQLQRPPQPKQQQPPAQLPRNPRASSKTLTPRTPAPRWSWLTGPRWPANSSERCAPCGCRDAPRPVAVITAVGTARPMAQGHAMMSTVIAATSAWR